MNVLIARKIAKAAGARLEFDRVLHDWEIRGSRIYRRLESEEFGRMTPAEFEKFCECPPQAVFSANGLKPVMPESGGAQIILMPSAADRALAKLRQYEGRERLPYERTAPPPPPPPAPPKPSEFKWNLDR